MKYSRRGFEIIGLSLDYDLEFLQAYLSQSEISWPQISDGRGWEMPLVEIYEVEAVPKNFLLDKTGVIRYKDLYGKKLESKIYELLNEEDMAN